MLKLIDKYSASDRLGRLSLGELVLDSHLKMPPTPTPTQNNSHVEIASWWSSALSSKLNLHDAIDFRALCGANLVT